MATRKKPAAQYHHGDLRAALVKTAWAVVEKQGAEALSLRSVAEALGVSHAAPAHHFADKAALLEAMKAEAFARFAGVLEASETGGLRAVGRAWVRFAVEHPRQANFMFRPGLGPNPARDAERARCWAVVSRTVALELGPRRAADAKELAVLSTAAWAALHGLASLVTEGALPATGRAAEVLRERVLDVVLAGLASA